MDQKAKNKITHSNESRRQVHKTTASEGKRMTKKWLSATDYKKKTGRDGLKDSPYDYNQVQARKKALRDTKKGGLSKRK